MEFRPFYLAREWNKTANNTLILGANFSHLRRKNPQNIGFESNEGVDYYWVDTPKYEGNGIGRVLNIFAFVGKIFLQKSKILKHIKPDVVVASSTHPFDIFPAWWIAKTTKAKLVFEIHDLWPLSLTELGGMSKYHPFVLLVALAEQMAYRLADKIISILPCTFEHVKKFGVKRENFAVVPNGIVVEEEKKEELPSEYQQKIAELKQQDRFLVCYAGAHGVANALTYLIDAAKLLEMDGVHVVLVGDGQEKANLEAYAKDVANVTFFGRIAKDAIPTMLDNMDALYIGLQKQPLFRFGISANKIFDYMLAGRPVISAIEGGNDPIADAKCGISVAGEDAEAVAQAVRRLMKRTADERDKMGARGRAFVLEHHDYKKLAAEFLRVV
jgi:glycosyltransferase involved in cell wall biosynthesis